MLSSSLKGFKKALEVVTNEVYAEIPPQQILLFLTVADKEGITQHDLQDVLNQSQAAISRNVKQLSVYLEEGEHGNKVKKGYGLLDTRPDMCNRKRSAVFLTKDGQALLETLEFALNINGAVEAVMRGRR